MVYKRYLSRGVFPGFFFRDIPKENPSAKMLLINVGYMKNILIHDLQCLQELHSLVPDKLDRVLSDSNLLGRITKGGARKTIPNRPIREAFTRTMEINQVRKFIPIFLKQIRAEISRMRVG